MKKVLLLSLLINLTLSSCGQKSKSATSKGSLNSAISDTPLDESVQASPVPDLEKYIFTDTLYPFSTGKGITIQNSLPKGGSIEPDGTPYIDPTGKNQYLVVFWTRIINETETPIAFNIHFPAYPLEIFSTPGSYLKLFLPSDTMAFDKLASYNYGITGLKTFLDTHMNKATTVELSIEPNAEYLFYTVALSYQLAGRARAALILKEQELYYGISIAPHSAALIPCGTISLIE